MPNLICCYNQEVRSKFLCRVQSFCSNLTKKRILQHILWNFLFFVCFFPIFIETNFSNFFLRLGTQKHSITNTYVLVERTYMLMKIQYITERVDFFHIQQVIKIGSKIEFTPKLNVATRNRCVLMHSSFENLQFKFIAVRKSSIENVTSLFCTSRASTQP